MNRWSTSQLGTRFRSAETEEAYFRKTIQQHGKTDAPVFRVLLVATIICLLTLPLYRESSFLLIFGFSLFCIALTYGSFLTKLPKFFHSEWILVFLMTLSSIGIYIFGIEEKSIEDRFSMTLSMIYLIQFAGVFSTLSITKRLLTNLIIVTIGWMPLVLNQNYETAILTKTSINIFIGVVFAMALGIWREKSARNLYRLNSRFDEVLSNVLPKKIAKQLIDESQDDMVQRHENCSILFADLVGFTDYASQADPNDLATMLDKLFSRFDMLAEITGSIKIKTIGDAYMCMSDPDLDKEAGCRQIADMALEMRESMKRLRSLTNLPLEIRIGVHTGELIAGVIGRHRYQYDIWGQAVNITSRLESNAPVGEILASKDFAETIATDFEFSDRQLLGLKGIGDFPAQVLVNPVGIRPKRKKKVAA